MDIDGRGNRRRLLPTTRESAQLLYAAKSFRCMYIKNKAHLQREPSPSDAI